ncbi:MAG: SLC13 family permease [Gammaproteobacteria bacterium]
MNPDQIAIIVVLVITVALFVWGRWRHDVVALFALLACVFLQLIPAGRAFAGFGHPAVITVACVLVLSHGLQSTGAVNALAGRILPQNAGATVSIAALIGLGATLSAFINNVGAMALLMPVAIQLAAKLELPPGKILMPLAFGTILGGMTTLIGTPPNLIVSGFRVEAGTGSFGMFDFTPVGAVVAVAGVVFVALLGWRIVPARQQAEESSFDTGTYLTEARLTEKAKTAGKTLREAEELIENEEAQIVGMVRNDLRLSAPNPRRVLQPGDILVIESDPESLESVLSTLGLKLEEDVPHDSDEEEETEAVSAHGPIAPDGTMDEEDKDEEKSGEEETVLQELAAMPDSDIVGRSASDIDLRSRYGLNLLAISRRGRRSIKRLRSTSIQAGDVLLMQGAPESLSAFAGEFGCVPLAQRSIRIPDKQRTTLALIIMAAAIVGAAFGLLPAAISFAAGALLFVVFKILPSRQIYEAIDWPVIILLGALIPVATAMASTGTADLLAGILLEEVAQGRPILALALIMVVSMTLSDFMNNAATAAVMCPIAISAAVQLGVNPDTFLMAVAVGASCAFLTPIGHQNNTLILGPGGFRFGDYWRLGIFMEILVLAIGIPMLILIWPL